MRSGRRALHVSQFEATARLSWERGQQMLFSYVRSKALGDLNTFTAYLGDFPTAPLRPNHYTNTRGDIPHRFIAWGIVNLPVEYAPRSHLRVPFRPTLCHSEARRHYVGIPYNDNTRFRNYISLDERMSERHQATSEIHGSSFRQRPERF